MASGVVELVETDEDDALAQMREGDVDAVIVVPAGYGDAVAAGASDPGSVPPATVAVYTDPSRQNLAGSVYQAVGSVLGASTSAAGRRSSSPSRGRSRPRTSTSSATSCRASSACR